MLQGKIVGRAFFLVAGLSLGCFKYSFANVPFTAFENPKQEIPAVVCTPTADTAEQGNYTDTFGIITVISSSRADVDANFHCPVDISDSAFIGDPDPGDGSVARRIFAVYLRDEIGAQFDFPNITVQLIGVSKDASSVTGLSPLDNPSVVVVGSMESNHVSCDRSNTDWKWCAGLINRDIEPDKYFYHFRVIMQRGSRVNSTLRFGGIMTNFGDE